MESRRGVGVEEGDALGGELIDVGGGDFAAGGVEGVDIAVAEIVAEDVEDVGVGGGGGGRRSGSAGRKSACGGQKQNSGGEGGTGFHDRFLNGSFCVERCSLSNCYSRDVQDVKFQFRSGFDQ